MKGYAGAPGFSQRTGMVTSVVTGVPQDTLTNPFPVGILRPGGTTYGNGSGLTVPNSPTSYSYSILITTQTNMAC